MDSNDFISYYKNTLSNLQFGERDMTNSSTGEYIHHYKSRIMSEINPSPKKIKRFLFL